MHEDVCVSPADCGGDEEGVGGISTTSPQKNGSRSNPNERMLIPSYIPMTQPSEPPRSPSKVSKPSSITQHAHNASFSILYAHQICGSSNHNQMKHRK